MWHWTCRTLTSACNCFNVAPEAGKLHFLLFICLDFSFVYLIKSENNRRIKKALHRIVYIASGLTAALISLYVLRCCISHCGNLCVNLLVCRFAERFYSQFLSWAFTIAHLHHVISRFVLVGLSYEIIHNRLNKSWLEIYRWLSNLVVYAIATTYTANAARRIIPMSIVFGGTNGFMTIWLGAGIRCSRCWCRRIRRRRRRRRCRCCCRCRCRSRCCRCRCHCRHCRRSHRWVIRWRTFDICHIWLIIFS